MNQRMTESDIEYVVAMLKAGAAVQISTDDRDGTTTGITGLQNHTKFAAWQVERIERRVSTHNS
jgi:hypothetical protein